MGHISAAVLPNKKEKKIERRSNAFNVINEDLPHCALLLGIATVSAHL